MAIRKLNILLIGGSGFVSGTLARTAIASGHAVWAVTRGQRLLPVGVIPVVVDRHDQTAFAQAIEQLAMQWDLVVDCIGYTLEDAEQDLAVFRNLARHFVFISTDFVYDPVKRHFPQSEESEHYLADGYGGQKRQCELAFLKADTSPMTWTIVRPGHIYGPGSLLGCLPAHARDPQLLDTMKAGQPLRLVGGGHFLQQPILAHDLAQTILSCVDNVSAQNQIYLTAGPDWIESREYYQIIAELLGVEVTIEEVAVSEFLAANPDRQSFLCHRIYDLSKLRNAGLHVPATPIREGLRQHVASLRKD
ncbi:MAG: NAD-dependent epimerase/dehydratase family protein [Chloroflexi bacterium]|nr:NAD-dependent epimerase/dehydratase family protein [Chloroflexota bacterium]